MRSFFFGDLRLVELLLQETDNFQQDAMVLADYIQSRVRRLGELDLTKNIAEYRDQALVTARLRTEFAEGPGIETSEITWLAGVENTEAHLKAAREALVQAWHDLSENVRGVRSELNMEAVLRFRQRDILWLGGMDGKASVTAERRALFGVDEVPYASCAALDSAEIGESPAVMEAYYWTTYGQFFFVISIKTMPVGVMYLSQTPPGIAKFKEVVEAGYMDRRLQLLAASDRERLLEDFLSRQTFYSSLRELRVDLTQTATALYSRAALIDVSDDDRERCQQTMMKRGFWVPLGSERIAVRGLALFSCLSACDISRSEILSFIDGIEEPLAEVETRLREFGFPERQIRVGEASTLI